MRLELYDFQRLVLFRMNSKDPTPKQSFGRPSLRNTTSQTTESQESQLNTDQTDHNSRVTETPTPVPVSPTWSAQPKPTPNMAERLARTEQTEPESTPIIALDWDDVPVNLPTMSPTPSAHTTSHPKKPTKATIKTSVSSPSTSTDTSTKQQTYIRNVQSHNTEQTKQAGQPVTKTPLAPSDVPDVHSPSLDVPEQRFSASSPTKKSQETRHKRIQTTETIQEENTISLDKKQHKEPKQATNKNAKSRKNTAKHNTAKRTARPQKHLGALHFWQAMGFSFFGLMLAGMAFLFGVQQNTGRQALAVGEIPQLSFLVAGRDVVYCYYRVPCQDQSQKDNLYQTPNTDTLMLVKTNKDGIKILNIPRDTNVGEFDRKVSPSEQKINAQYWLGGPEHLVSSVEEITGEHIDAYAIVRTEYVENVIDALGGLDVNVPKGGIQWVDQAAGINLDLDAGAHHLWGKEAVHYLRVRKGFGDDYGRIDHQKQAIAQLVDRLKTPQGLLALPTILSGVDDGVETNLDPQLMSQIIPQLTGLKLQFATLPTTTIRGTFNLTVDEERLETIWNAKPVWIATKDITSTYITIWDATGKELGTQLRLALMALGFEKVRIETLPARQETSQVFTHGGVKAANHLAELLRLPRLQGERFPVGARGVGILLGTEAGNSFAALLQAYVPNTTGTSTDNDDNENGKHTNKHTSDTVPTVANTHNQ